MSLQWTLIAYFLYAEIVFVLFLVLPIFSAKKWNSFFRSRFLQALGQQAGLYFVVVLAILVLFLLDSIREMRKYSSAVEHRGEHHHLDAEMQESMRLFRAQRNFYITGFALFLSLVIRRLITLISNQAQLMAQCEAAVSQARNASNAAKSLLAQKEEATDNSTNEKQDGEISKLKNKLKELEQELETEKKDKKALTRQAESLNKEYDRLTGEYSKLQKKVDGMSDKKAE